MHIVSFTCLFMYLIADLQSSEDTESFGKICLSEYRGGLEQESRMSLSSFSTKPGPSGTRRARNQLCHSLVYFPEQLKD